MWRWLQIGKLVAVAERLDQRNWGTREFVKLHPDQWSHRRPSDDLAFWVTGDIDLAIAPDDDRYAELANDPWGPEGREVARLTGVRIDADTIPFQQSQPSVVLETRARGRRPAAWWDDLWVEIARQIYCGELMPDTQSNIEKAMHDWIAANGHEAGETTVRDRARRLFQALNREVGN